MNGPDGSTTTPGVAARRYRVEMRRFFYLVAASPEAARSRAEAIMDDAIRSQYDTGQIERYVTEPGVRPFPDAEEVPHDGRVSYP